MQAFLTKLLTVDLPGLIVLPRRLDVNIPPSVGAVAEAAVGRDAVMRAIASAVLQACSPVPLQRLLGLLLLLHVNLLMAPLTASEPVNRLFQDMQRLWQHNVYHLQLHADTLLFRPCTSLKP